LSYGGRKCSSLAEMGKSASPWSSDGDWLDGVSSNGGTPRSINSLLDHATPFKREASPLSGGYAAAEAVVEAMAAAEAAVAVEGEGVDGAGGAGGGYAGGDGGGGRGLHSSTFQLNMSALYGMGDVRKGLCSPC